MLKFYGVVEVDRPFEARQSKKGNAFYTGSVGFKNGNYKSYIKAVSFGTKFDQTGVYAIEGRIDSSKMGVSLVILNAEKVAELSDDTM